MSLPTADVSVRIAWADDASAIAQLQAGAWQERYADLLPASVLPTPDDLAPAWAQALARPGDARNRVLVALERNRVCGYAVTSAASDPDCDRIADGELADLTVAADEQRKGHGSRLLQAAVDTMVADKFTRSVSWTIATDDALRNFLTSAGWGADSAHRELDLDGTGAVTVKQVRLHTALT